MKEEKGHIEIGNKIYFVYYKLPKPEFECGCSPCSIRYRVKMNYYEASKQKIEVSNVSFDTLEEKWIYDCDGFFDFNFDGKRIINNQKCKAKIINNKANIIELITKI